MNLKSMLCGVSLLVAGIGLAVNGYSQSFLTNGLVAYYPFNGNTSDESGTGNSGTNKDVVFISNRYDQTNSAGSFSGKAYVECPSLSAMPYLPVSYSVWFKLNAYPLHMEFWGGYSMTLVGRDSTGSPSGAVDLLSDYRFGITNELVYKMGSQELRSYQTPATNKWIHVVFTCDSSRVGAFYLEGQLTHSESYSYLQNVVLPFRIGAAQDYSGGPPFLWWNGAIDDVRIYNRALSSNEVAELHAFESGSHVDLVRDGRLSFSNLWVGTNYQLLVSSDLYTWTNNGSAFTATNSSMFYPQQWDLNKWAKLFFRLQVAP